MKFYVEYKAHLGELHLHAAELGLYPGEHAVALPATFERFPAGVMRDASPPLLKLHQDSVQELVDELHRVGFVPTKLQPKPGVVEGPAPHVMHERLLSSVYAHLQDMRALTFGFGSGDKEPPPPPSSLH